ncbi:putative RDD family membrane protein YckC [Catenuloplanes nepalensis]|uniref:RDD family membrane protein YckC n=1 Tax=Catenuloplanes nepalensis TaxID=587533 RepID=A0ABT9N773_9ACTN|nr:RDD family protein [Catenuloplanes nepalensis]MDP9799534.1 putative RDD family membrane protein YckC [Catenuloplanes nepalensis]
MADGNAAAGGLISGEAVEVEIRVARPGSRVLALAVDIVVQIGLALTITTVLVLVLGIAGLLNRVDEAVMSALTIIVTALVLVGYPTVAETLSGGRTAGKSLVGIRVVRDDGGPIQLRHAFTRALVGVALEWPGLVLPLVTWVASLFTMLTNPLGKRLGDLAAGTIVIHDRAATSWGWVPGMPPALAGWALTLDLTGLGDDLALAVRHFLSRGSALVEPDRSRLGRALATEVASVTAPPPPPGVPDWAFLAAVLAERHRRATHRLARNRSVSAALWPSLPQPGFRPLPPVPPDARAAWPSQTWPRPPWQVEHQLPDWTGMTPPPMASTLRAASPPENE